MCCVQRTVARGEEAIARVWQQQNTYVLHGQCGFLPPFAICSSILDDTTHFKQFFLTPCMQAASASGRGAGRPTATSPGEGHM